MRLIDADELKNKFWHGDLVPNKEMYHISEIMYAINNAPTVEERPHGKWIVEEGNIFNSYVCSKCKEIGASDFNFCPNCGADMREADR